MPPNQRGVAAALIVVFSAWPAIAQTGTPIGASYTLEGLYLHLTYTVGIGGAVYTAYKPYALLKDGAVTDDLTYYPQSSDDVAEWRRRKPRAWGRWTKNGSVLSIRWDDSSRKPETWKKWFETRPGSPGLGLKGRFQSLGGGGNTALGGDVMVAAWNSYEFLPDGTVTSGGGSGGSSEGAGTGVSVVTGSQKAEQRGRYRVDGYSIEFQFSDGRREGAGLVLSISRQRQRYRHRRPHLHVAEVAICG